jgi:hypothetical protein
MNENELNQLWLLQPQPKLKEMDTRTMLILLDKRISRLERLVKRRDRSETTIAIAMIVFFGWLVVKVPFPVSKIGAAIIAGSCILIIYKLKRARKVTIQADPSQDVTSYLKVSLEKVQKQAHLLRTVLYWYFLPLYAGVISFYLPFSASVTAKLIYGIFVTALYGFLYVLNRRAFRRFLMPLQKAIVESINELSV